MKQEVREVENTPEKAIYQVGEGKDALTLSVSRNTWEHRADFHMDTFSRFSVELKSNDVSLYNCFGNINRELNDLAEKVYDDQSKEAKAVKSFLSLIKGNSLAAQLKEAVEKTPERRKEREQRDKEWEEERQRAAKKRDLEEKQNKKNAENALNKFLGVKDEPVESVEEPDNKLARVRRKVAKKVGLEDVKLPSGVKKVEGKVSKMIFEKRGGKSGK